MYAIVNIAGQQFKVEKGKKVYVHKLPGSVGDEVSFDKVMLISNDEQVTVGSPFLTHAIVYAQIISQLRGDKVLVFKKKRRKSYQKMNGHRQYFTEILIEDIAEKDTPRPEKKKAAQPKQEVVTEVSEKAAPKATSKKATPKAETEEKPKKAAVKKVVASETKKPAAKKAAAKSTDKSKS